MKDLFNKGLDYYGLKEIKGKKNNPLIEKMHEAVAGTKFSDEIPWCSAFMNWICAECGYKTSRSLAARSWLEVGEPVEKPERGVLCVFWRKSPRSWQGHVALYVREDEKYIYCLGGNQSDSVNISKYDKSRLLEYIKLDKLKEGFEAPPKNKPPKTQIRT